LFELIDEHLGRAINVSSALSVAEYEMTLFEEFQNFTMQSPTKKNWIDVICEEAVTIDFSCHILFEKIKASQVKETIPNKCTRKKLRRGGITVP
jgi:hypothetical protein